MYWCLKQEEEEEGAMEEEEEEEESRGSDEDEEGEEAYWGGKRRQTPTVGSHVASDGNGSRAILLCLCTEIMALTREP